MMMFDVSHIFDIEYEKGFYCGIGCCADGILLYVHDYHMWIMNEEGESSV